MKAIRIFIRRTKVDDETYDYDFVIADDECEADKLSFKYNYKEIDAEKLCKLL